MKKIKIIGLLATIFFLIFSNAQAFNLKHTTHLKQICNSHNGIWREFSDNCADSCSSKFKNLICARSNLRFSCDCGNNRCWNSKIQKCHSYKEYQPFYEDEIRQIKIEVEKMRNKASSKLKATERDDVSNSQNIDPIKEVQKDMEKSIKPEKSSKVKFINAN